VGGGKHGFPDGVGLELELLQERRFAGGMVFLRYRVVSRVRDPAGNVWWLQTRVEEVSEEENARRMAGERYLDRDARS
jgi:hypothetical protein